MTGRGEGPGPSLQHPLVPDPFLVRRGKGRSAPCWRRCPTAICRPAPSLTLRAGPGPSDRSERPSEGAFGLGGRGRGDSEGLIGSPFNRISSNGQIGSHTAAGISGTKSCLAYRSFPGAFYNTPLGFKPSLSEASILALASTRILTLGVGNKAESTDRNLLKALIAGRVSTDLTSQ